VRKMAIIRWDPFRLTPRWLWRWPSLWEEEWLEWPEENQGLTVYETENEVVVKANVAGVPPEKVDISIEGGVLTIKAEHKESEEEKKRKKVIYRQARQARYLYTTSIPCPVQEDKASATVKDGIVTITLPKAPSAKPKKIKVKVKK
jgi:HSP20 family protein